MTQSSRDDNPRAPPLEEGTDRQVAGSEKQGTGLGVASLACALVFPATLWGVMFADANRMLGPAPPGVRTAMVLFLAMSSLAAIVLGLLSLSGGVRATALIGAVVGVVELLMCMGFSG